MAWIEVHQALATHRKLRHLARLLGVRRGAALGHLVCLWLWALDNAPDGDLADVAPEDVREAADWPKKPWSLIDALIASGWLDKTDTSLMIHDWHEYAGRLVQKRAANSARMKSARDAARFVQRSAHVQGLPTQQNSTEHNTTTTTTQPASDDARAAPVAAAAEDVFLRCVRAYDGLMGSPACTPPIQADMRRFIEDGVWSTAEQPAEWFEDACAEAARQEKRSLSYVHGIIKRWRREGRNSDSRPRVGADAGGTAFVSAFAKDLEKA